MSEQEVTYDELLNTLYVTQRALNIALGWYLTALARAIPGTKYGADQYSEYVEELAEIAYVNADNLIDLECAVVDPPERFLVTEQEAVINEKFTQRLR
jgi:hypothetical protein